MHLSKEQIAQLKANLEAQAIELRSVTSSLEKTDPALDPERGNENADEGDDATESREMERHESLEREANGILVRVEEALARIEEGTYGHTVDGVEIPFERLMIDPTATTTVS
jgi:DnaK suppressor protein